MLLARYDPPPVLISLDSDNHQAIEQKDKQIVEFEKLKNSKPFGEAQCGAFLASEKGWRDGENTKARCAVSFPRSYAAPPKLLFGLSLMDAEANRNRALGVYYPEVRSDGFSVEAGAWNATRAYNIGCNWLVLPDDLHLETGVVHTYGTVEPEYSNFIRHVFFSQSFATPPKVCVWIQAFEYNLRDFMSIKCYATDVNCHSFHLKVESWAGRRFKHIFVQYLAYPSEEDGKRVKSGRNMVNRGQKENSHRMPFYGEPFKNTPKTFIAISETDFCHDRNTRFRCSASAPNNRELEWSYGTWGDTNMDHAEIQWIALE